MGPRNTWPKIPGFNLTFFFHPEISGVIYFTPFMIGFFGPCNRDLIYLEPK